MAKITRGTLTPPDEFGNTRYIARYRDKWVVGAQQLRILLLRLRDDKYDSVYRRVGDRMVPVPSTELDPVAEQLRREGWADVV